MMNAPSDALQEVTFYFSENPVLVEIRYPSNSMAIILARCFVIYPWLSFFMFTTCDISIYLSNNIYRFATTTPCHFFEYFGEMADKSNGVEGVHLVYL